METVLAIHNLRRWGLLAFEGRWGCGEVGGNVTCWNGEHDDALWAVRIAIGAPRLTKFDEEHLIRDLGVLRSEGMASPAGAGIGDA